MTIKSIIIDDEQSAIKSLKYELSSFNQVLIAETFTDIKKAQEYILNNSIDLLFLDIEMPDLNGINFLELLIERRFEVIFVTAHRNYAFDAYKNQIIDYLLKPVDSEDLKIALDKYTEKKLTIEIKQKYQQTKPIWITDKGQKKIINISEINYCEADGNYTIIYLLSNEKIVSSNKLLYFEELLMPHFIRCHHSYLVKKAQVKIVDKKNNILVLKNDKIIPVSRQKKKLVFNLLSC